MKSNKIAACAQQSTAIIYTRVSSDDQVAGTSLTTQERDLRAFCAREGYEVIAHYQDAGESAKTANRPGLIAALDDAKKRKAAALIVHKLDRLSRNANDGLAIRAALAKHNCTLVSATEPAGNDPLGQMVSTLMFAIAQFDNEIRSQRCRAGMAARARQGGAWAAPIGLRRDRTPDGIPILVPDGGMSASFRAAVLDYIAGGITKRALIARLTASGFKLSAAYRNLRKPIYGGIVRGALTDGEEVAAAAPSLFSPAEWRALQARLGGRRRCPLHDNPAFPFVGAIFCSQCSGALRAGYTRNRGRAYGYYFCSTGGHVSIRRADLHEQAAELLRESGQDADISDAAQIKQFVRDAFGKLFVSADKRLVVDARP